MADYTGEISFNTVNREEIINMTGTVEDAVKKSEVREGIVLVYPLHTSSAVYISDSDIGLTGDFAETLRRLVPAGIGYAHDENDYKKNADGHIKAVLAGHHVTMPVTKGKLHLGTYQTVYYFEFDGGRKKEVLIKVIGN
ncbi:MAG: secondary thiamine-phosphate synthase enzyme YjbQ [Fibrobacterota bacterium]